MSITTGWDTAGSIDLRGVGFLRDGRAILSDINWHVRPGEHWAIVGPNGCGKSTLLQLATGYLWPNAGSVSVLGEAFGQVDLRQLRRRIGWVSSAILPLIRPFHTAMDITLAGAFAATGLFDEPTEAHRRRAVELHDMLALEHVSNNRFGTLSLGEQQKVLVARAMMNAPEILILDEACAGLDLPSREGLLAMLDDMIAGRAVPNVVLVTHHIEEITPSFTHAMVLAGGQCIAQGPKAQVLTGEVLGQAFGLTLKVDEHDGRYWPRVTSHLPRLA
jgi:iron complex transport system ATP-binding protein